MLASAPIDFHVSDSYFVVAHMHYVLFGGSVFALYAGIYYWWPKVTGRLLSEGWGKVHFWMTLVGFHLTFLVQHVLGLEGMPRRVADYFDSDGFTGLNQISSIGAFLLGASTLPFLWNAVQTLRGGWELARPTTRGTASTLEWATTSPPPPENFTADLPPIRSQRPVWDRDHPEHTSPVHTRARAESPRWRRPRRTQRRGGRAVTEPSGRPVPGTEGPRGHELHAPVDDRKVPWRVFLTIGTLVLVLGAIYWATAYEESGTVDAAARRGPVAVDRRLPVAAHPSGDRTREGRGVRDRRAGGRRGRRTDPGTGVAEEGEYYLPHASAWPFAIGLGAATLANGLVLGLWVIVPGAALMALGIGGFVRQSRRRD